MSSAWNRLRRRGVARANGGADEGMTLPEVLISMIATGIVVSTLGFTATVILRQIDNTEGRANNARSEQNVNLWMPIDLASAEAVDKLPGSMPCGGTLPACPAGVDLRGSNALMLTWHGRQYDQPSNTMVDTLTVVSYRVVREADGEFRLYRVQCNSVAGATAVCTSQVVLRNLNQPPATVFWQDGITPPTWVMTVTDALAADDISGAGDEVTIPDPSYQNKGAQRVVVTINGGGDAAAGGGGQKQISLTAGGTNREIGLNTDDLTGTPNFTAARSRCGGNFGMVVDHSTSIQPDDLTAIKDGINTFIDTFAGTPIKLQIVTFGYSAETLGSNLGVDGWTKYFDMLVDGDVSTLKSLVNGIPSDGYTNWEDGLFRMLRNKNGTVQSQLPGTLIFFTDGMPNRSRIEDTTATDAPIVQDPLDDGLGGGFQRSWNRAERIVRDRGAINLIGVYVDTSMNMSTNPPTIPKSTWTVTPQGNLYEVANNVVYETVVSNAYFRNANVTYQISGKNMKFEKLQSGSWVSASRDAYLLANTTPDNSDGWRVVVTKPKSLGSWVTITATQYNASNTVAGTGDGFQTKVSSLSATWTPVNVAEYTLSNTTSTDSDGWRVTPTWGSVTQAAFFAGNVNNTTSDGFRSTTSGTASTWAPVTAAQYTAANTGSDATDGWRATYHSAQTLQLANLATIGNLIAGNTTGVAGGFVEALPRGGPYTDAAAADLFALPNYTNFANALASIALDQCGGTVTLQTKVGTTSALDPFKYQISTTNETVQTSLAYRSGTFDVALPGGAPQLVTISPQDFTSLTSYTPNGWSCRAAGQPFTDFTAAPVPDHAPWTSITLTVNANKAVSCVQQVIHS